MSDDQLTNNGDPDLTLAKMLDNDIHDIGCGKNDEDYEGECDCSYEARQLAATRLRQFFLQRKPRNEKEADEYEREQLFEALRIRRYKIKPPAAVPVEKLRELPNRCNLKNMDIPYEGFSYMERSAEGEWIRWSEIQRLIDEAD